MVKVSLASNLSKPVNRILEICQGEIETWEAKLEESSDALIKRYHVQRIAFMIASILIVIFSIKLLF